MRDGRLMPAPGESADFPALIPPMLAVPARELPAPEAEWAAEFKWDGVRAVAYVSAGGLRLVSRNGRDMTRAYPELAELAGQAGERRMVLDGEIVVFARGRPSFAGLQRRMLAREPAPYLVADVTVGGISPGQGEQAGQIGSLLVGVPAGPGLVYAGRVGTGFTRPEMGLLLARLAPLRRDSPPFTTPVPAAHARNVIWVQPQLVIEVTFAEWTPGGILRAAAYRGMKAGGNRAGAGPLGLVCHPWLRRRSRSGPVW